MPARRTATGRVIVWGVRLTPLGVRVLAGRRGDEFERFREMMEESDG